MRIPRVTSQASNGPSTAPTVNDMFQIVSIRASGPTMTPAEVSEWPARYFVALCQTRSTPSAIGRWLTGVANVLSASVTMPRSRAIAATAAMSVISSRGLLGDSIRNSRVAGVTASAQALTSVCSTRVHSTPRRGSSACTRLSEPPYMLRCATTWSPARTSASTAVVSAPMPEPKTRPRSAPSSVATASASSTWFGFPWRV